jgi:glycine/D-amino acid oxidase-like deaminating enzyme
VQLLERTDVAIVGGGIIGIACALELLAAGRSVTVIERDEPGAGTAAGSAGYLSDFEPRDHADLLSV